MSTRSKAWLLLAAFVLGISIAHAEGIGPNSFGQTTFGGIGSWGVVISTAPPPVACGNGTINLSTGCTQPMLGGL